MPYVPQKDRRYSGNAGTTPSTTIELAVKSAAPSSVTEQSKPRWSCTPHVNEWAPEPTTSLCCCGGTNDLYVRLELLETRGSFQTKALSNAGVDFPIPDRLNNAGRFNLKGRNPRECNLRVIIYDEDWGDDRLLGYYNKVNLAPLLNGNRYVEVPTEQDGVFTGNVYIEVSLKGENLIFKVLGCGEVNNMAPEAQCGLFSLYIALFVIAYIMIYALVIGWIENPYEGDVLDGGCASWSSGFDDILWFVLVTFASVGYGDQFPCTDNGRIANGIFIILNQLTLAWFFTIATQLVLMQSTFITMTLNVIYKKCIAPTGKQLFKEGQHVLARDDNGDFRTARIGQIRSEYDEVEHDIDYSYKIVWEPAYSDDDGSAEWRLQEELRANDPLTFARLNKELRQRLLVQSAVVAFFVLIGTILFVHFEKDEPHGYTITYAQAFHFSVVTMSTVGYGDWAPSSRGGRAFGSFFILAGVSLLANFAGILVEHFIKKKELEFSHEFLNSSLVTPKQLLQFDFNGDGSVDKYEYLVRSLVACRFVEEDKIDLIMSKFFNLDADKSGQINLNDFKNYAGREPTKL